MSHVTGHTVRHKFPTAASRSLPFTTAILDHAMVVVAFSSLARILGECSTFFLRLGFFLLFFFFKVEISSHTLIPLFRPGSVHSGSAS